MWKEEMGEMKEREKEFQTLTKQMIMEGLTEAIFTVSIGVFESRFRFLESYNIAATAKATTFRTFLETTRVKSYRYMGMEIHFLITG